MNHQPDTLVELQDRARDFFIEAPPGWEYNEQGRLVRVNGTVNKLLPDLPPGFSRTEDKTKPIEHSPDDVDELDCDFYRDEDEGLGDSATFIRIVKERIVDNQRKLVRQRVRYQLRSGR